MEHHVILSANQYDSPCERQWNVDLEVGNVGCSLANTQQMEQREKLGFGMLLVLQA
jgi:hypothetical protein